MKSITILNRISECNLMSIAQAELLTKALHREGKLSTDKAIRFRPLYSDFDIVNSDLWTTGVFDSEKCKPIGNFDDLKTMFI